jgi:hypothetical protein
MELVHATNADKTNVTSFAVTFGIPSDAPRHPDPGCRRLDPCILSRPTDFNSIAP